MQEGSSEWREKSFWFQQFLVPLGSIIIGAGLSDWIVGLYPTAVLRVWGGAIWIIACMSAAISSGYTVRQRWPLSYGGGRIVWILPMFFLSLFFLIDLVQFKSASHTLHEFFYSKGDWAPGFVLATWPTLSCCLYSLGMVVGHKRASR